MNRSTASKIFRRGLLAITVMALAGAGVTCSRPKGPELPNIVLIVADDLGWADVGYHSDRIRTPHIDRLTEEGLELDRFYVSPICSPTRAGLMTGRYPIRYGMARSVITPWRHFGLDPGEVTIAEVLADAGYKHRALFGKWHLGHLDRKWHPLNQGFTHFHGHYNGAIDYFTHQRQGERDWHLDYEPLVERGYSTDLIADAASRFIEDNVEDGPFFCVVSFNAPHQPLQAPAKYVDMYPNLNGPGRFLAAMVTCLDDAIGRILERIDSSGIGENTIVWFLSDNGGIEEIVDNNLPLRGNKLDVFEGGIRVPACIRWSGTLPQGGRVDVPTAYIDVLPTLMDIVGIDDHLPRPLDGVSLVPVIEGTADLERDLFFYHGNYGPQTEEVAILSGDWKLIVHGPDIRSGVDERHQTMLFRIGQDPSEKNDLAASYPDIVRELEAKLVSHRALQPANAVEPFLSGRDGFRPPKDWRITKD